MPDRRLYKNLATGCALLCLRILALCLAAAIIMFVLRQWKKKLAMSRTCRTEEKREQRANLAYENEDELKLAKMKGMSVEVTSAPIDIGRDENDVGKVKRSSLDSSSDDSSGSSASCESRADCACRNCRALLNLTECGVCWESLQSGEIKSCPVCANVICVGCAVRMSKCAFCRSELPAERNRALERLVYRLMLPCKNSRSGCKLLLDGESRFLHESVCSYAGIGCPVGRGVCSWRGTVSVVTQHLYDAHNLQPLRDHGISVEIHNFRSKARATDGRVYTVCLSCYDQLFVIRVVLFQSRLRLSFTRLGHETAQPLTSSSPPRHGIEVLIRARAGRRLRGLVPFGKYDRESREISFTCDNLYSSAAREPSAERCHHANCKTLGGDDYVCREKDLVKIDLLVKQLEES